MKYSLDDNTITDQITKNLQQAFKLTENDYASIVEVEECIEDLKTLLKKLESFDEYESEEAKEYIDDMKVRARNYNSQLQLIIASVNNTAKSSQSNSPKNTTSSLSEKTPPKTTASPKDISNEELARDLRMLKSEIANNLNYGDKNYPQKKPASPETSRKETKAKVEYSKDNASTSKATRDNFIEPKKTETSTSPRVEDTKSVSLASSQMTSSLSTNNSDNVNDAAIAAALQEKAEAEANKKSDAKKSRRKGI